jgi:hypothetical protein
MCGSGILHRQEKIGWPIQAVFWLEWEREAQTGRSHRFCGAKARTRNQTDSRISFVSDNVYSVNYTPKRPFPSSAASCHGICNLLPRRTQNPPHFIKLNGPEGKQFAGRHTQSNSGQPPTGC